MILVMHWAVKSLRLNRLAEAKSISLSVDDRKDFRLLRYRCNLPSPSPESKVQGSQNATKGPSCLEEWCDTCPLAAEGSLGVYRLGQTLWRPMMPKALAWQRQCMNSSSGHAQTLKGWSTNLLTKTSRPTSGILLQTKVQVWTDVGKS